MSKKARRIIAVLLAVTLAIGLTVHSARAAAMDAEMAAAKTSNMAMPDKCDGCAHGKDTMSLGACAAFCSSMAALPSLIVTFIEAAPAVMPAPVAAPNRLGLLLPPDPYPPKPVVLT